MFPAEVRFLYDVIDPKPLPQSHRIHFGVSTDHFEALLRPPVKIRIVRRHRTGATFFLQWFATYVNVVLTCVNRQLLIFVRRHRLKATSKTV